MNEHMKSGSAIDPSWSDPDAAVAFLKLLRPRGPWALSAIYPDAESSRVVGDSGKLPTRTFMDAKKARAWIAARSGKANLYYTLNRTGQLSKKPDKGDVLAVEYQHVDIDSDDQGSLAGDSVRKAAVVTRLSALNIPGGPTLVVDSGGGLQALWRLDGASDTVEGKTESERVNEALIAALGGDGPTWSIDHLMRLPGTVNLPDARKRAKGRVPAPTLLLEANDRSYGRWEFPVAPDRPKLDEVETVFGDPEPIDDLDALANQYSLSDRTLAIIRDGEGPTPKDGGDNSRSGWLFSGVLSLAYAGVPPEQILGIITDPRWEISASVLAKDNVDEYAERQVRNALRLVTAERSVEFADDISIESISNDATATVPTKATDKYRRLSLLDLLQLPSPKWLVKDWITEGGLFGMFGGEKSYKTFLLLDMLLRASVGMDWHGIPLMKSRVQYVIGEGNARRFADRIIAWCIHNGVSYEAVSENFKVVPVRVGVDNDKERGAFIAADHGQYDVTIFDTMARNMDGDENATRDMSKTIAAIDEIRSVYHSAGGFAHHTGKDVSKGARGSSALAGAVDALIEVKHNQATGEAVVTLYRSRDSEQGVSRVFKPKRVMVTDPDVDDEMRFSLVMEFVREGSKDDQKAAEGTVTSEAKTAIEKILVHLAEHNGVVAQKDMESDEPGMSHANVNKAFVALRKAKLITGTGPIVVSKSGAKRAMELGAVVDVEIDQ